MIEVLSVGENRLMLRDGEFVCCDTPVMRDYYERFLSCFHGRVLLTGLGLGVALSYVCSLPAVTSVDCVERDISVLAQLPVVPPKCELVLADAWEFSGSYDCCFHDIWSDFVDQRFEAARLEARFDAPFQVSLPLTF